MRLKARKYKKYLTVHFFRDNYIPALITGDIVISNFLYAKSWVVFRNFVDKTLV